MNLNHKQPFCMKKMLLAGLFCVQRFFFYGSFADKPLFKRYLNNLLEDNPWIKDRGFEPCEVFCKELAATTHAENKLSFIIGILDKRQLEVYSNWLKTIE